MLRHVGMCRNAEDAAPEHADLEAEAVALRHRSGMRGPGRRLPAMARAPGLAARLACSSGPPGLPTWPRATDLPLEMWSDHDGSPWLSFGG